MEEKPPYEELEQRIKELEYFIKGEAVKTVDPTFGFFNFSVDMLCIADLKGRFKLVNDSFTRILGYSKNELYAHLYTDFVHPDDLDATKRANDQLLSGEIILRFENRYICKDGSCKWLSWAARPILNEGITYAIARDVTHIKQIEEDLAQTRIKLEQRVEERTRELKNKTHKLRAANTQLKRKESELNDTNHNLVELNTTLKILIQQRDENRKEFEKKIHATMNTLIKPYMGKLARICPDSKQQNILKIINLNLQEVVSPFARNLTSEYMHLTATEIQVADLIRNAHSNKEIAELLNLSPETIIGHRKNIRKKLGITKTKTNLVAYLRTIA